MRQAPKKVKIPARVLAQAKGEAAEPASARRVGAQTTDDRKRDRAEAKRKVVAGLRRLHPMD